jgi:hypothetical protein
MENGTINTGHQRLVLKVQKPAEALIYMKT